jgi:hypothetical protein
MLGQICNQPICNSGWKNIKNPLVIHPFFFLNVCIVSFFPFFLSLLVFVLMRFWGKLLYCKVMQGAYRKKKTSNKQAANLLWTC